MPTLFKMSDEKQTTEIPAAVVISGTQEPRAKKTKKYVIIAVGAILGAAIVLTAILVGMYMFTEAQKEIIKYSLQFNQNVKQDVVADPNTNIVQYHVTQDGHEAWIINDFNKDIQVVKIQTDKDTVCYMNALNRSAAMDPSQITKPTGPIGTSASTALTYVVSNTPVSDTSFLPKAARDMCKGISVYWVYPHCSSKTAGLPANVTDMPAKSKRQTTSCAAISYVLYAENSVVYNVPCVSMCCKRVCACQIQYQCTVDSIGRVTCTWYTGNCPPQIYANPVDVRCISSQAGYVCPNQYPAQLPNC